MSASRAASLRSVGGWRRGFFFVAPGPARARLQPLRARSHVAHRPSPLPPLPRGEIDDYEGYVYVLPIETNWVDPSGADFTAPSYGSIFDDSDSDDDDVGFVVGDMNGGGVASSDSDAVSAAVARTYKGSDRDTFDFSDQYQLAALFEDWMNGMLQTRPDRVCCCCCRCRCVYDHPTETARDRPRAASQHNALFRGTTPSRGRRRPLVILARGPIVDERGPSNGTREPPLSLPDSREDVVARPVPLRSARRARAR